MEKKACPRCGSPLKKMIYGEPDEMALSDDEIEMGCMCFGDSRDGMYFCIKCEKKFSEDLLPVDLVDCPLEESNCICAYECRQYDVLEKKEAYRLLDDREKICGMICPAMEKEVKITLQSGDVLIGRITRTFKRSERVPEDTINIYQERERWHGDYKEVPISQVCAVEPV